MCVCVCVCVSVARPKNVPLHTLFACSMCVAKRERERERERDLGQSYTLRLKQVKMPKKLYLGDGGEERDGSKQEALHGGMKHIIMIIICC